MKYKIITASIVLLLIYAAVTYKLYNQQESMLCASEFDVYFTDDYVINNEENVLITSHDRVYILDKCVKLGY